MTAPVFWLYRRPTLFFVHFFKSLFPPQTNSDRSKTRYRTKSLLFQIWLFSQKTNTVYNRWAGLIVIVSATGVVIEWNHFIQYPVLIAEKLYFCHWSIYKPSSPFSRRTDWGVSQTSMDFTDRALSYARNRKPVVSRVIHFWPIEIADFLKTDSIVDVLRRKLVIM